ncbi:MAG: hypothetical protein R3E95_22540, partial [Thiolinea sp.]
MVALDQMLVYNRFGSFNPFGMMYALKRDVVPLNSPVTRLSAEDCDAKLGTEYYAGSLEAGDVRLKDCKRPRPLVLRTNAGDILHVRLTNYLRAPPDFSSDFCQSPPDENAPQSGDLWATLRSWVAWGDDSQRQHGEVACSEQANSEEMEQEKEDPPASENMAGDGNWPRTRGLNFAIQGLSAFGLDEHTGAETEAPAACKGLATIAPNQEIDCYYKIDREGPYFLASTAAPAGGQGDGGSISHGLFGAVVAQKQEARW